MGCCSISELRCKEVISAKTGCRLGCVSDVEIDLDCGRVIALLIYGKSHCGGLICREDDIRICWDDIEVIGKDTILVCKEPERRPPKKRGLLEGMFK